jgi:hypothetical protein
MVDQYHFQFVLTRLCYNLARGRESQGVFCVIGVGQTRPVEQYSLQYSSTILESLHSTDSRLLARVLKEGVQFWYNDTSSVKRGGGF